METLSSILAWRIPWTEEPGRLQFSGEREYYMNYLVIYLINKYQQSEIHYLESNRKIAIPSGDIVEVGF